MLDLVNLFWFVWKIRRCEFRGLFRGFFGAFVLGVILRI
jgi:hypothetical protein